MKFTREQYNEAFNKISSAALKIYQKPQYNECERNTILGILREVVGTKKSKSAKMAMMLYVIDSIIDKK